MFHDIPIESLSETDLAGLIAAGVRESKAIEYKLDIPGPTNTDKQEFLYDVSSFANAVGGDILYGVESKDGLPTALAGLEGSTIDATVLRLDQLSASGISPRIPGLRFHPIVLKNQRCVLLARVPRTWAGPHMVTAQNANKFYSRNSAGKYLLDVNELRTAFSLGESLGEKIRSFRLNRAGTILNGELTVQLLPNPKVVLHICPTVSFQPGFQIDLNEVYSRRANETRPMSSNSWGSHFNFDGLLTSSMVETAAYSYLQTFRSGCFESVDAYLVRPRDGKLFFPSVAFEKEIIECGIRLLSLLEMLKVESPYVAMLTFLGVRGCYMYVDPFRYAGFGAHPIERDHLYTDDILIEDDVNSFSRAIRPAFDQVWNACGWPGSLNYDEDGNWRPHQQ